MQLKKTRKNIPFDNFDFSNTTQMKRTKLLSILLILCIGCTDNMKMPPKTETLENSIYAVIAFPKHDIDSIENNIPYVVSARGINGTCFFVGANQFITANHVLNKNFFERQIYFLINKNGQIINGVSNIIENSDTDMSIGEIDTSINSFCKIPKPKQLLTFKTGQEFTAYGFSAKETMNFKMKVIKENGILRIIEHDPLTLKKITFKFIRQMVLKDHFTIDKQIHLKNCNVLVFDSELELGFSGGPTFDPNTNMVIGFASQWAGEENKPVMFVVPVTGF